MKKGLCWLLLSLGAGGGCLELPGSWPGSKPEPPQPAAAKPAPPPEPVTPDQVTEANAHEKAEALKGELDRETQGGTAPVKKPAQK
jgi:hypothetical protein